MKKTGLYILIALAVIGCFAGNASASFYFSLDTDYKPGDAQAVFSLKFTTDAQLHVDGYGFEFKYDADELTYQSYTNTPPSPFVPDMFGPVNAKVEGSKGYVNNFNSMCNWGHRPNYAVVDAGTYTYGTFTFNVNTANLVADGNNDFDFDFADGMFAVSINGSIEELPEIPENFHPPQLDIIPAASPVPVPAAVWLFGSGLIGLVGLRRKND